MNKYDANDYIQFYDMLLGESGQPARRATLTTQLGDWSLESVRADSVQNLTPLKSELHVSAFIMGLFSKSSQKETQKTKTKKVASSPEALAKSSPTPTQTINMRVQEKTDKVSLSISNWQAFEKTRTKEIRSPIFPVYFDAGESLDKVLHR